MKEKFKWIISEDETTGEVEIRNCGKGVGLIVDRDEISNLIGLLNCFHQKSSRSFEVCLDPFFSDRIGVDEA